MAATLLGGDAAQRTGQDEPCVGEISLQTVGLGLRRRVEKQRYVTTLAVLYEDK
jgi:hypothetical protein